MEKVHFLGTISPNIISWYSLAIIIWRTLSMSSFKIMIWNRAHVLFTIYKVCSIIGLSVDLSWITWGRKIGNINPTVLFSMLYDDTEMSRKDKGIWSGSDWLRSGICSSRLHHYLLRGAGVKNEYYTTRCYLNSFHKSLNWIYKNVMLIGMFILVHVAWCIKETIWFHCWYISTMLQGRI